MFKRTNKLWKGLALVLALCMISTVAYADPSTAVIQNLDGAYDAATKTVTISGKITAPGNDVTILALRSGAEYDALDDVWTEEMLPEKVIYIDQEASDETTGEFSFSFMPRAGVSGGCISVFVGGEDVAAVEVWSTDEAGEPAPTLVPEIDVWYEGVTELTFDLMSGDEPFENADDWGSVIDEVTIEPENADVECSYEDGKVTFTGFDTTGESLEKIEITTVDNAYAKAVWTGELAQEAKNLGGNVLSASGSVVAGGYAEITVTTEDEDWMEDLAEYVLVDEDTAEDAYLDGDSLFVLVDLDGETLEDTVTITVSREFYEDETVDVTVIAPTKNQLTEDANIAAITVDYSATVGDEDAEANMGDEVLSEENATTWGQASITLPAAPTADFNYIWTIACEDVDAVLPEDADTGLEGTVVLDRPDCGSDKGAFEYTLTLTIEDAEGAYADATKEYTLRVNEVGVVGVDVIISLNSDFISADAVATASVKVDGDAAVRTDYDFVASAITDGTHVAEVSRPGYVTFYITFEVEGGEVVDSAVITDIEMIPGDIDDDGDVDIDDFAAFGEMYNKSSVDPGYNAATDLDGDNDTDIDDFAAFGSKYNYVRPVILSPVE